MKGFDDCDVDVADEHSNAVVNINSMQFFAPQGKLPTLKYKSATTGAPPIAAWFWLLAIVWCEGGFMESLSRKSTSPGNNNDNLSPDKNAHQSKGIEVDGVILH